MGSRAARSRIPQTSLSKCCACLSPFLLQGLSIKIPTWRTHGYRKLLAGKWTAVYRVEGEDVLVARVFHQRADYLGSVKKSGSL